MGIIACIIKRPRGDLAHDAPPVKPQEQYHHQGHRCAKYRNPHIDGRRAINIFQIRLYKRQSQIVRYEHDYITQHKLAGQRGHEKLLGIVLCKPQRDVHEIIGDRGCRRNKRSGRPVPLYESLKRPHAVTRTLLDYAPPLVACKEYYLLCGRGGKRRGQGEHMQIKLVPHGHCCKEQKARQRDERNKRAYEIDHYQAQIADLGGKWKEVGKVHKPRHMQDYLRNCFQSGILRGHATLQPGGISRQYSDVVSPFPCGKGNARALGSRAPSRGPRLP